MEMKDNEKLLIWWEPGFGEEEADAVADVVRSGFVNEGKVSDRFAEAIQEYLDVKYVLPNNSGTVSLFMALVAAGVKPGDEVIVPGLSFMATASAVALAGAVPVFADILGENLNLNPQEIERLVSPSTRAVMPVHVNGRAADMETIRQIANRHNLAVVEDAAEALGSFSKGRALGTIGDAGCISLAPTKMITAAQGGLVLTNREDVRDAVIRLKDHGRLSRSWNYHPAVGYNFKFNDILAALALEQLKRLPERLEKAKREFLQYREGLSEVEQLKFVATDMADGQVPLWVDAIVEGDREAFIQYMREHNIVCRPFWPAMHIQDAYRTPDTEPLPVVEKMADQGIWFPSGFGKTEADITRVVETARNYFK
jgi:dTDP-4-amino-4,6-dideoxygalactose transaminase